METSVDTTMRERAATNGKSRWIFGWVGLTVVIGAIWFFVVGGRKVPVHNGVPVDAYLVDLGRWRTQQNYEASIQAIRSLGTNTLPYYATAGYGPRPWYASRVEGLHRRHPNSMTSWLNKRVNSNAALNLRKGARRALDYFKYDNLAHSVTNDLTSSLMTAARSDVQAIASLPEFERVRVATAYCLYAGIDNSFMEFLENRAGNEARSRRLEAERALVSIYNSRRTK